VNAEESMPYDKATMGHIAEMEEEEAKKSGENLGARRKFNEFECPTCSANNPFDDFGHGDEVHCAWCGLGFTATVDDDGRLKLRES
jgi:hypothetical protein